MDDTEEQHSDEEYGPRVQMSKHVAVPLYVRVHLPVERRVHKRGIESTNGPLAKLITFRGVVSEKDRIKKAASYCNLTYNQFMRDVILETADKIIKAVEEHDAQAAGSD